MRTEDESEVRENGEKRILVQTSDKISKAINLPVWSDVFPAGELRERERERKRESRFEVSSSFETHFVDAPIIGALAVLGLGLLSSQRGNASSPIFVLLDPSLIFFREPE